ncbi:MAG: heme biosynthesis HemY N-terminal domain-containing protein [Thalassobaculum sp.]|uniref:heme biosynthesis protein HemY n=1 Tax=Thalassobaculum sp. TaxID=2022740 RepID=UPI0032EB90C2
MRRSILYLIRLALLVAVAIWLVRNPGEIRVDWLGWRLETSFALFAVVTAGLIWLGAIGVRMLANALGSPWAAMRRRSDQRREAGFRALTLGLAAVAAGDAEEARRQAREADRLLRDPTLTRLLSAQAAALNGDTAAAAKYFAALRDNDDTRFLGLVGLLRQAIGRDDEARALELAEEAHALRPDAPLVATTRLYGRARAKRWFDAQVALYDAVKRRIVPEDEGLRHRAAILTERAREDDAAGRVAEALDHAGKARESVPGFVPAITLEAALLGRTGKARRGQRLIEDAWARVAHPALAAAYRGLAEDAGNPIERFKRLHALAGRAPDAPESRLTIAEAALEAELWGEARVQLEALSGAELTARACRLRARLEESEHGDSLAARHWLERATTAPADPAWTCGTCGAVAPDWSAVCGHCGAFDTVVWAPPPRVSLLTEDEISAPEAQIVELSAARTLDHVNSVPDTPRTAPGAAG